MARRDEGAQPYRLSYAQERMLQTVADGGEPFDRVRGSAAHGGNQATLATLRRDGMLEHRGGDGWSVTNAGLTALAEASRRRAESALKAESPRMSVSAADAKARELVRAYLVDMFPGQPHHHSIRGRADQKLVRAIARELREASRP